MIDPEKIDQARLAHLTWRSHLRQAVATGKSAHGLDTDRTCEFGKWLHDLSDVDKQTASWQEVNALHVEFHAEATKAMRLAIRGQKHEAELAMAMGSPFAAVTSQLSKALEKWKSSLPEAGR
jgi:hypothetical protein